MKTDPLPTRRAPPPGGGPQPVESGHPLPLAEDAARGAPLGQPQGDAVWLLRRPCRRLVVNAWAYPLALLVGLLGLWEGAVSWFHIPRYILPAPSLVAATLVAKWEVFFYHTAITLSEVGLGATLGIAAGLLLGLAMFFFAPAEKAFYPLLVVSQNIPVFALAPLLVVWFGYGLLSKVVMAALIIFFPITVSVLDGLKRTDADQVRLFQTMNATQAQILWKLRLPAALPALFSGLKLSAIYSTIGAVIGEWVGAGAGLGYLMLSANAQLRVADVFGAIFCLTPIGLGLLGLVVLAERWCIPWQHVSRDEVNDASAPPAA